jgi:putative membrane protein
MKKLYCCQNLLIVVLLAILLSACSQDLSYLEAMRKNERKIEDTGKLEDAKFLVEAKSYNLLESRLTQLATTTGYASKVVELAKRNLNDHEKMEEELDNVARKEKVVLPSEMDETHEASYYEVSKTSREDFDKAFLREMKELNDNIMQKFLVMATEAKDDDVRAFAARKLTMLRTHAERFDEVEKELLNTY